MKKPVIWFIVYSFIIMIVLFVGSPTSLLSSPVQTPIEYLETVPYWTLQIGSWNAILIVPSSTFFVYLLGVVIILLGLSFLKQKNHLASKWWGISMVLWGIGALLAGTSYQAFGYELKCNGVEYCLFTSGFELSYLYTTALSIGALMIGTAYVLPKPEVRTKLIKIAIGSVLVYSVILVVGTLFSIQLFLTYELFTIFFLPHFTSFFVFSIMEYRIRKEPLHRTLITTWILFLIVNVSYFVYYFIGIGPWLYDTYDIWFSANDVLHIALLLWMIYIWIIVKPQINGYQKT